MIVFTERGYKFALFKQLYYSKGVIRAQVMINGGIMMFEKTLKQSTACRIII